MILSRKAETISPSLTLAITAKAKEMKSNGIDVISFGVGEPDFNTPQNIQNAAVEAMKKGYTKYTPASGIIELKKAVVDKLKKDNNLNYKTSQIIISTGAKQCLSDTFFAILNPGDEVLIANPYWVSYPELVKLSDGVPVIVETLQDNDYKFTVEVLEKYITKKTKAIILNSPNNPTGTIYTEDELKSIADFAEKYDLLIISDEIYEKLIYGSDKHISIASLSKDAYDRTIVINGLSKSYAMTGWRIGYAAASEKIISLMSSIQSHTTSNPSSIAQYASVEALNGNQDKVLDMIKEFKHRRNYMVDRIDKIDNIECIKPKGAFYVFINISKILNKTIDGKNISDSMVFSKILLEEEKVAVVPGVAFGNDNYIRLSYATSMENIKNGLDRIENFIKKIKL